MATRPEWPLVKDTEIAHKHMKKGLNLISHKEKLKPQWINIM